MAWMSRSLLEDSKLLDSEKLINKYIRLGPFTYNSILHDIGFKLHLQTIYDENIFITIRDTNQNEFCKSYNIADDLDL